MIGVPRGWIMGSLTAAVLALTYYAAQGRRIALGETVPESRLAISAMPQLDPEHLYDEMKKRGISAVEFGLDGWAYHVESVSKEKLYISGIRGSENSDFAHATAEVLKQELAGVGRAKAADLIIVACGSSFGAGDSCDLYSELNKIPRTGDGTGDEDKISWTENESYQKILRAAVQKLQSR